MEHPYKFSTMWLCNCETPSQNKAAAFSHLTPAAVAPGFWPFFGDLDTRSSEAGSAQPGGKKEEERCHWFVLLCPLTLGKPYNNALYFLMTHVTVTPEMPCVHLCRGAETPNIVLPAEEDLIFEEKLLHSPYDVKLWLAYLYSKKNCACFQHDCFFSNELFTFSPAATR